MDVPALRAKTEQPGSLREIHYLCVFAPLRLCVFFFKTATISMLCILSIGWCIRSTVYVDTRLSKIYPALFCVFFLMES